MIPMVSSSPRGRSSHLELNRTSVYVAKSPAQDVLYILSGFTHVTQVDEIYCIALAK